MLTLRVEGIEKVIRELERRDAALNAGGRRLISDYGAFTHDLTFQLSPYDALELTDTFHMRENIRIETSDNGLAMEVGWAMEDFTREGFYPYYLVQEFGSVNQDPQPSLGPAWNELEPSFIKDARKLVERSIARGR